MSGGKTVTREGATSRGPKVVKSQSQLIKELLKNAQTKLRRKESKPSLGDYIRLLQLQKELEEEEPREIRLSWVEKPEKIPDSGNGK
jgi:hypothetical protein